MHTHRNLLYPLTVDLVKTPNIIQMIRMLRRYGIRYLKRLIGVIGKPITIMYTMPPFTGAGMVATVMFLLGGRITVLQDRFSTSEAISLIEKEKVNLFGAVPALAALMLRDPKIKNHDLSSLIYLGCGAAFVSSGFGRRNPQGFGMPNFNFIWNHRNVGNSNYNRSIF